MGLPVEVNPLFLENQYAIQRSLRFRASASASLTRTPSAASNQQKWTWSGWIKRGQLSGSSIFNIFGARTASSATYTLFLFNNDSLYLLDNNGATVGSTAVYRDVSSFYHIICSVDTTQATAANRVIFYVNGVQVTSYAAATYPSLNLSMNVNSTETQLIGQNASIQFFDGYMAEVNFIDGQALTPSSFGQYNEFGVWSPRKYGGSYGTNGFYLPFLLNNTSTYAGSFNGSNQFLTTPSSSAFNLSGSNWTVETWFYCAATPPANSINIIQSLTGFNNWIPDLSVGVNTNLTINSNINAVSYNSTQTFTLNSWNHVAVVNSGGTIKVYLNGQPTSISVATTLRNQNMSFWIGKVDNSPGGGTYIYYFNGYISNLRIVNGTAVYTAAFVPPTSPLTAITNTSLLTLQNSTIIDNSTNNFTITNTNSVTTSIQYPFISSISADYSGNGNNWASNNISLSSGTTYDAMTDVPPPSTIQNVAAGNYCVLNPLKIGSAVTLSNGNLNSSGTTTTWNTQTGTIYVSSGKWYAEVTVGTTNGSTTRVGVGIALNPVAQGSYLGSDAYGYAYYDLATKYNNNVTSSYGATYTTGDIIGIAVDLDAGTLVFYKNNTTQGTAYSGISGSFTFAVTQYGSGAGSTINFGQQPFSYTPPSGFLPLNSNNLPAPTIPNGAKVMAATLWTGDGTGNRSITGTGFKPDFLWVKTRSTVSSHRLQDSVRGANNALFSNLTNAEATNSANGYVNTLDSDGFSTVVGATSNVNYNENGTTFVGWQWNAGSGTSSSNTDGTITSTVSVNKSAGFSVVTWTGNGSATADIGHGLGASLAFIIVKNRTSTSDWWTWHWNMASGVSYIGLNTTNADNTVNSPWGGIFNSTVFRTTNNATNNANASSNNYVAYCWTPIAGYSAVGKYTGNGSADGPFVYTGFRPRYLMYKNSSFATTSWSIIDSSRNTYNVANARLFADLSSAEDTSVSPVDFLSNGFKVRATNDGVNRNGDTIIYAAFAENPFKLALAR